ncbi:hypothetical protein [Tepidimicrobium xylanilyticum]|uniref:Uncharacterized protein n=1 Tax=Tepidimicrobium xylanilyticum TaxID=1123352 RepID=A0A1H3A9L0_9FIRM|nr:hypothetical protein [Tepidimicrobium xylanilyticum]GMG96294.1 hypothetical protein EN5CB1_11200 [Tepidimicrobium xylanilyticum]SDX25559.1 hypothetical protein SAMN05660923_02007 [Tepidimicrobium xylanilyticum]
MYNMLLLMLLLSSYSKKEKKGQNKRESFKKMELNIPYTLEKIELFKKIGPYFPSEYVPLINRALMITEKFIKLYQTMEFLIQSESNYILHSIPVENNQQRLSYIADTIKKELSNEEINRIGVAAETILTLDKFNKLLTIFNSIMSNPEILNTPANMMDFLKPLMEGRNEKEKKQIEDMTKMIEIMKTLNLSKKTNEKEKLE